MQHDRAELESLYRRYLQRCNEHRFSELGEFVAPDVEVNGAPTGVQAYGNGLREVIEAFPDFHWDLQHLLVDGCWLSAHLIDTGTTPEGEPVTLHELAMYRLDGGRIVATWGDLEPRRLGRARWHEV